MVPKKVSYVNGVYTPHDKAVVHIEDRGYQFSDGVYEIIAFNKGRLLDDKQHFNRLKRSLKCLDISMPVKIAPMNIIIYELLRRNAARDGYIYIQITRGVAPRNHPFPREEVQPSLVIMLTQLKSPPQEDYDKGVSIITGEDMRWRRKDIKSISLLANVLAKQEAVKQGVKEIWLIDSYTGKITEGSSTNAFIIGRDGTILTHPKTEAILGGVTRDAIIKLAKKAGFKVNEEAFTQVQAKQAKEAFLTSTTMGILPVVKIDNVKIGNGKPGQATRKLIKLYSNYMKKKADD